MVVFSLESVVVAYPRDNECNNSDPKQDYIVLCCVDSGVVSIEVVCGVMLCR